jgi:hypothetical protein
MFLHAFFHMARAQRVGNIPADPSQNDLLLSPKNPNQVMVILYAAGTAASELASCRGCTEQAPASG